VFLEVLWASLVRPRVGGYAPYHSPVSLLVGSDPSCKVQIGQILILTMLRYRPALIRQFRAIHSTSIRARDVFDPNNVDRPSDDVDVCIVGGGPAGLSAAIRLKQLEKESGKEIRVVVLEKGAEVGKSFSHNWYFHSSGRSRFPMVYDI
jgi:NADPH-dependent 2,4-dienoyl-CoA reductase/sulfur reductase-like enzyme